MPYVSTTKAVKMAENKPALEVYKCQSVALSSNTGTYKHQQSVNIFFIVRNPILIEVTDQII